MDKIYEAAQQREQSLQSRYVDQINKFETIGSVKNQVENDLLDVIIFCKWILEKVGKY